MCLKCVRFVGRRRIRFPSDPWRSVERIRPFVSSGVLKIVQANSPIEEIGQTKPLKDVYVLAFQCSRCGREFQIIADMYHGRGYWE